MNKVCSVSTLSQYQRIIKMDTGAIRSKALWCSRNLLEDSLTLGEALIRIPGLEWVPLDADDYDLPIR